MLPTFTPTFKSGDSTATRLLLIFRIVSCTQRKQHKVSHLMHRMNWVERPNEHTSPRACWVDNRTTPHNVHSLNVHSAFVKMNRRKSVIALCSSQTMKTWALHSITYPMSWQSKNLSPLWHIQLETLEIYCGLSMKLVTWPWKPNKNLPTQLLSWHPLHIQLYSSQNTTNKHQSATPIPCTFHA